MRVLGDGLAFGIALDLLLILAERDGRVNRQAYLLQQLRVFDAAIQCVAQQGNGNAQHATQQGCQNDDQRFLRLDRLAGIDHRIVNDPDVTNRACAHHIQLLRGVEHRGIDFGTDLHIPRQAQQLLLGSRQIADTVNQRITAAVQLIELFHQRLIAGVLASEAALHFRALELQLRDGGVQLDHLIQNRLGLEGDVDRSGFGLIGIQRLLGCFELASDGGQLLLQEVEALLGLCGFSLDVLQHIQAADFIKNPGCIGRARTFQVQQKNTGVATLFTDADVTLIGEGGAQTVALGDQKLGPGIGNQLGDLDAKALFFYPGTDLPLEQQLIFTIEQRELSLSPRPQDKLLAFPGCGHLKLKDIQLFPAPGVAVHAQQGVSNRLLFRRAVTTVEI